MSCPYSSLYRPIMARGKRSLDEMALATKSDSDDDDYSDHQERAPRRSRTKGRRSKPSNKKRRQDSEDDDIVSDEDELLSDADEMSFADSDSGEDANAQRNARGLVARRAAAKRPAYDEGPSDEEQDNVEEEEEDEDDEDEQEPNPPQKRKSTIITLKLPNKDRMREALEQSLGNRRITRRTRGASEDIFALTNSGRHAEAVQRATHSPEASEPLQNRRASRETRGLKNVVVGGHGSHISEEKSEYDEIDEAMADIKGSQLEIQESTHGSFVAAGTGAEDGVVPESENGDAKHNQDEDDDEDDEDEGPTTRRRRTRISEPQPAGDDEQPQQDEEDDNSRLRRSGRKKPPRGSQRKGKDDESDFEPEEESHDDDDDEDSQSEGNSQASPRKGNQTGDDDDEEYTSRRPGLRKRASRSRGQSEAGADVADELAEELHDLRGGRSRRRLQPEIIYEKPRRNRKNVDYRIIRPDVFFPIEEAENEVNESPSRRGRGGGGAGSTWQRTLFPTYGPFGGGGSSAILGPSDAPGAAGGVDSDSSDDEAIQPTKAPAAGGGAHGLATPAQTHGGDPGQGASGTPGNLGKVKDKQALADADPLGVDLNVNFESVGGLQGHIDQLKEMVSLPLLYPEIFQRFHIVPPRGVLFHGPPGTGKTLLARALANSVSSEGRKVTFYMRKGADALSKWVGEAERQLRLLFDEARKTQPSIIFFDEIDGKQPPLCTRLLCSLY